MNQMSREHVLILTATVRPGNVIGVARSDPQVRLNDYLAAFRLWVHANAFQKIIFCENSGFDLDAFKDIANRAAPAGMQVEFLSFAQPPFPPHRGKGYGEMLILSHVLREARLLDPAARVVKVTGRLFVRNARQLVAGLRADPVADVFCDLTLNLTYSDSRVFAASRRFLEGYFLPMTEMLGEVKGVNFESALARATHLAMASGLRWAQLPVSPDFRGISGGRNTKYGRSMFRMLSSQVLRRVRAYLLSR